MQIADAPTTALDQYTAERHRIAGAALAAIGWDLRAVEIDLVAETARVEVARADGLTVTFDARHGKATVTREMAERYEVAVGRRGDRARVERVGMRFLGRERIPGMRAGLRWFADYLGDNGTAPELGAGRTAIRALLGAREPLEVF